MSGTAATQDTYEYALDMLAQLANMAKSEGLDRLAERISAVIAAERTDADKRSQPLPRDP